MTLDDLCLKFCYMMPVFLSANRYRPRLFTAVDGCNDFINAVFLPVSYMFIFHRAFYHWLETKGAFKVC